MSKYFLAEGSGKPVTDPSVENCVGEFDTLKEVAEWLEENATSAEQDELWDWLESLVDLERDMKAKDEYWETSRRKAKMRRKKK